MKKISLLVAGVLLSLTMYSQNGKIDWNADLDYLAKELSEKHFNFFTIKSKNEFLSVILIWDVTDYSQFVWETRKD